MMMALVAAGTLNCIRESADSQLGRYRQRVGSRGAGSWQSDHVSHLDLRLQYRRVRLSTSYLLCSKLQHGSEGRRLRHAEAAGVDTKGHKGAKMLKESVCMHMFLN